MTDFVSRKAARLKQSETFAIKTRAAELNAAGQNVVDLSIGEPDIDTPEHIKQAAVEALRNGKTKYTATAGIPDLLKAIVDKYWRENGLKFETKQIIVTNGGKQALYSCLDCVLNPGDEVILQVPYWVSYVPMIEMAGGVPVFVRPPAQRAFKLSPQELEAAITPRTKMFIFNSPSNPVGLGYSEAEIKALGAVLEKYPHVLILSDEIYEKIVFRDFKFVSFAKACPKLADRTITAAGCSKSFAMTGWRVGWAAGPLAIIDAMVKHQSQTTSNINSVAQYAAVAALNGPMDSLTAAVKSYARRVGRAVEILSAVPGLRINSQPIGAFYVYVTFAELRDRCKNPLVLKSSSFARYLLDEGKVACVPGEAFGDDDAIRLSVAAPDVAVESGCDRIAACVGRLLKSV
ncbi:MAG: pyridoxal phosphate-dependent aminotransferase [Oligoflexia bacterium]|nr:pyridoxal phosphate-dependent aminotransferase [Oligoflexia bacterium]